ncbi:MAG: type II toxin-antitoxin system mRNA interferase toxin, RelE/StbE family [Candidatus Bathyarchaeota archaeon]|nr:type II toxin-antitoxin system mRNA interferase toxin, RelE/StbE family [Candidatus Bathyarchaeota archaeon]
MYTLEIEEEVYKTFKKLSKKDKKQLEAVNKKIKQIMIDPTQFKPLKHPLKGLRRVHIGPFVLIYEVHENPQTVRILKYKHHDEAYL